ncbi:MAG: ribosome biogenesis GTP-binding protein YihA/YsxC [Proteobacteria bacterium]|nr:ribosome biogenesis GTP-binding protein YihA/YsxC [Pseudomonadota bacterium]
MKVTDARFIKSVYHLPDLPKQLLPELAFSGRSNVGKSSLINVLLNRKGFAKTSSTPGRTQSINFMEINSSFYFVDLPGYGYANVPLAVRKKWQPLIEGYLAQRTTLRLLVLLADIRREPQEDEELFVAWLKQLDIPLLVVLTKIDKVKKNSQVTSLRQWQKRLDIDEKIVLFSAVTGEGKEKIWRYLDLSLRTVK